MAFPSLEKANAETSTKKNFNFTKIQKKIRKTCQGIQKDIIIKYNMPSLHSNSINTLNS
jgi:hypothetical protein